MFVLSQELFLLDRKQKTETSRLIFVKSGAMGKLKQTMEQIEVPIFECCKGQERAFERSYWKKRVPKRRSR